MSAAERLDEVSASVRRIEELISNQSYIFTAVQPSTEDVRALNSRLNLQVGDNAPSAIPANPQIRLGTRIFHSKFGYGTVLHVEGNKLEADFDNAGKKRVLHTFVTIVDDRD